VEKPIAITAVEWFEKGKEMRYPFREQRSDLEYVSSSRDVFVLPTTPSKLYLRTIVAEEHSPIDYYETL